MDSSSTSKALWALLAVIVVIAAGYFLLRMPDRRTTSERVADAVDALPHGVNKAADQLGDRTPVQKAGDALQKADDKTKKP